jgi:sugar/nucleoside kinase (ribokinase family)
MLEFGIMDLLAIGGITFDHLFWVDRLPEKHFEGIIKRQGRFYGGRAPNVAVAAAKLGIKTGLVSSVGEDFASEGYEDYLGTMGVDLRGVIKVSKKKTKQIFIFTDLHGNQITFFDYGAERHFGKMNVPCDLIKESRIVHISSSGDYRFNLKCARFAYKNGISISFDVGNDPFTEITEYLEGMISCTTFLFMNDAEASKALSLLKLGGIEEMVALGPEAIIVIDKRDKSSLIYHRGPKKRIPSILKTIRDPTGASDGYIAGFLWGCLNGHDVEVAGRIGVVEASFIVERMGSQTHLPSSSQLRHRLSAQFGIEL